MGESSKIEWTDHTFNPWWGCTRVSPGCEHCYAEAFAKRTGNKVWGTQAPRRFFGDKHWAEPIKWNRDAAAAGNRARVFCASMADVFEDRADLVPHRARLFELIAATPTLDWLLLTKRPQNVMRLVPEEWHHGFPGNIWLGTTCEDQPRTNERVPILRRCPAAVHFLSMEPLIEAVVLDDRWLEWLPTGPDADGESRLLPPIRWVIVGGESGPGARPSNVDWHRSIIAQCKAAGVAVFEKQLGANEIQDGIRRKKRDPKGGDQREMPHDLRVRELPQPERLALRGEGG